MSGVGAIHLFVRKWHKASVLQCPMLVAVEGEADLKRRASTPRPEEGIGDHSHRVTIVAASAVSICSVYRV